jgi:hypothetical protein
MEGREMKKKAIFVALLCVMGLAALSIGNAEAAPPWYTCTISLAGTTDSGYYVVTLSDTTTPTPVFTDMTFLLSPGSAFQKEMYAAALTAFANSTNVSVNIPYVAAGGTISALYAIK